MYAARLQRPTPYVDKTVYVGWNSLCVSAYLEAAKVLNHPEARRFALRSLDRVWLRRGGILRKAKPRGRRRPRHTCCCCTWSRTPIQQPSIARSAGLLEDYAFTVLACLDAYEATCRSQLLQVRAGHRRHDDREILRRDLRRILRQRTSRRRQEPGRAGYAAQAPAGFADAGGKSDGGDRAGCACITTPARPSIAIRPSRRSKPLLE